MWVVSKALWPGSGSTPALGRLRRRIRQLNNFCWRSLVLREDQLSQSSRPVTFRCSFLKMKKLFKKIENFRACEFQVKMFYHFSAISVAVSDLL